MVGTTLTAALFAPACHLNFVLLCILFHCVQSHGSLKKDPNNNYWLVLRAPSLLLKTSLKHHDCCCWNNDDDYHNWSMHLWERLTFLAFQSQSVKKNQHSVSKNFKNVLCTTEYNTYYICANLWKYFQKFYCFNICLESQWRLRYFKLLFFWGMTPLQKQQTFCLCSNIWIFLKV